MNLTIPNITDERLNELLSKIKPLVRNECGQLCHINMSELKDHRTTTFSWSPKITKKVYDITVVTKLKTLHTFNYAGFFKPTIAEVLSFVAQLDEYHLKDACYFEVVGPDDVHDINLDIEALNAGFHVAKTILYRVI
jgi:hypothetical protein